MNKSKLRKEYKTIRNNITSRDRKNNDIYNKVINNKFILEKECILIYISINSEVDTYKIIEYFLTNKLVAVPKIKDNNLKFYYIDNLNQLTIGKYNIPEPTTNNLVTDYTNTVCITPGICFSKNGYRLGYGGGYYDRFFKTYNAKKIGLCYKECLIDSLTLEEYDEKVDEIICNN